MGEIFPTCVITAAVEAINSGLMCVRWYLSSSSSGGGGGGGEERVLGYD